MLFSHLKGFLQETCHQNCFQQPSIKRDQGKTNMGTGRQKMKLERNEKPKGHRKQKGKKQIVPKALLAASPYACFLFQPQALLPRKPDPSNAKTVSPFSVVSIYFPRVIMPMHITSTLCRVSPFSPVLLLKRMWLRSHRPPPALQMLCQTGMNGEGQDLPSL